MRVSWPRTVKLARPGHDPANSDGSQQCLGIVIGSLGGVHPIERLRYVARSTGVDQRMAVRETAAGLASFANDPHALVTACRRMLARQPASGHLVWLCCHMLAASDPRVGAREALEAIEGDCTSRNLAEELPDGAVITLIGWPETIAEALPRRGDVTVRVVDADGQGAGLADRLRDFDVDAVAVPIEGLGAAAASSDLVLLEAAACGPDEALTVAGSRALAAVARSAGAEVWLVAGVGTMLPVEMWDGLVRRLKLEPDPWLCDAEITPLGLVDHVVGHSGKVPVTTAGSVVDCPVVTELCRDAI